MFAETSSQRMSHLTRVCPLRAQREIRTQPRCSMNILQTSDHLTVIFMRNVANRLESSECGKEQQSPSKSETEVLSMKPPARPPLSEVLVEPSLVTFKSGFNPFAKLDNSQPSYSIITHSPGPIVGLSTSRKTGLSLNIRKRKFVMSPSKPHQEKPAKQVMNAGKFEENKLSATPPLFATPSSSRKSIYIVSSSQPHISVPVLSW